MKNCRSLLWEKISYILKWNPLWYLNSFTDGDRLQIFSRFQKNILAKNLPYIYMIIILMNICVILAHTIYSFIPEGRRIPLLNFTGGYTFFLSIGSAAYHILLLILLKVKCSRDKVLKIIGILNVVSFIMIRMLFGFYAALLSFGNSRISLIGVSLVIFESSVIIIYFQEMFRVALFFCMASISIATWGTLARAANETADFPQLVSWSILC